MGLDMYLSGKKYISEWNDADTVLAESLKNTVGKTPGRVKYLVTEAGYWRKANAIHAWFVKHVQGGKDECVEHSVSRAQLQELMETCLKVQDDNTLASELLPRGDGFFFGGASYDEYYFKDIDNTVKQLTPLLMEKWADWDFAYQSSW